MDIIAALKKACEVSDLGTVRSYSGRGMYGKNCVGIDVSENVYNEARFAFELALSLTELGETEACNELATTDWKTDDMGRGKIVYFPDVCWYEDEDEFEIGDVYRHDLGLTLKIVENSAPGLPMCEVIAPYDREKIPEDCEDYAVGYRDNWYITKANGWRFVGNE